MPKEERVFDTNGVLRSRTLSDWTTLGPQGTNAYSEAKRDPRVNRSVSIMFDPLSSSALATLSETDYDDGGSTDLSYFPHLNPIRKKGYHYAVVNKTDVDTEQLSWTTIEGWFTGKLATVSETDYSYSSSYRARGIIELPTETRALNPANLSDVRFMMKVATTRLSMKARRPGGQIPARISGQMSRQVKPGSRNQIRGSKPTPGTIISAISERLGTPAVIRVSLSKRSTSTQAGSHTFSPTRQKSSRRRRPRPRLL
jgi:hypothetical protein